MKESVVGDDPERNYHRFPTTPPASGPEQLQWYQIQARLHEQLFVGSPDPSLILLPNGKVATCNPAALRFFGIVSGVSIELLALRFFAGSMESVGEEIVSAIRAQQQIDGRRYLVRGADGRLAPMEVRLIPLFYEDAVLRYALVCRDLTREETDRLTGCMNIRHLDAYQPAVMSGHSKRCIAALFIDGDDIGNINKEYSHDAGDAAICRLAEIIQKTIRRDDALVRRGGDEFLVVIDCQGMADALTAANKILEAIRLADFQVPGVERALKLTASIGVALVERDDPHFRQVFVRADRARQLAKSRGKNQVRFV